MPSAVLTDLLLRRARPAGRVDYFDLQVPGLVARISPEGRVRWSFRFRYAGKYRREPLGPYPEVSLPVARGRAREARRLVSAGDDPREVRLAKQERLDFGTFAARYLEEHAKRHKRSWRQDEGFIRRELLPRWRHLPADAIARRHVIDLLEEVVGRGAHTTANRIRQLLSAMYAWGLERDLVPANPVAAVKARGDGSKRTPVLDDDDLRAVWDALAADDSPAARLYRCLLYTGQREQEIRLLDLSRVERSGFATIPAEYYKTNREHRVYLVAEARALLADGESGPAFPSPRNPSKPIAANPVAIVRFQRASGVAHFGSRSVRSTVATRLAGMGVPESEVGIVLGHAPRSVTGKHYIEPRVYDPLRKRLAMAWARELHRVLSGEAEGAEVVRIG